MATHLGDERPLVVNAERLAADLTDELAGVRPDLDRVVARALAILSRARRGTWVAMVMNSDPSTSMVVAADHEQPAMATYAEGYMASLVRRRSVPTAGMSQQVIDSGQARLISSATLPGMFQHLAPAARAWYQSHPAPMPLETVSTIIAPMRAAGVVVGTLQLVEWNGVDPLTEADTAWMQTVADRLGMLVEHAQCHTAAIVRLDRLTAIRNVSLALASSHDLRLTLHLVLEQLVAKLPVDAAVVLQVDSASHELKTSASVGFHSGWAGDVRVPVTAELGDAAASGRRFEVHSDPAWLGTGRRSLLAREGFVDYHAVPLVARSRLLGVLEVFARTEVRLDEEWTGFLHAMAVTSAVAIDNAALHERVERSSGPVYAAAQRPDLSPLEWRILALVADGATNREVAAAVHLSENTIKFHIRRLLDRLGAVNRTDLARKVTQNSWL